MIDLTNGCRVIDDDKIVFYDNILYVIMVDDKFESIYLTEYDEPVSLSDVSKKYPDVKILIADDMFHGEIYRYGNHKTGEWEKVGTTIGYA